MHLQSVRAALGLSDAPLVQQFFTYLSQFIPGEFWNFLYLFPGPGDQGDLHRPGVDLPARVCFIDLQLHHGQPDRHHRFLAQGWSRRFDRAAVVNPDRFVPGILPGTGIAVYLWGEAGPVADRPCL